MSQRITLNFVIQMQCWPKCWVWLTNKYVHIMSTPYTSTVNTRNIVIMNGDASVCFFSFFLSCKCRQCHYSFIHSSTIQIILWKPIFNLGAVCSHEMRLSAVCVCEAVYYGSVINATRS